MKDQGSDAIAVGAFGAYYEPEDGAKSDGVEQNTLDAASDFTSREQKDQQDVGTSDLGEGMESSTDPVPDSPEAHDKNMHDEIDAHNSKANEPSPNSAKHIDQVDQAEQLANIAQRGLEKPDAGEEDYVVFGTYTIDQR